MEVSSLSSPRGYLLFLTGWASTSGGEALLCCVNVHVARQHGHVAMITMSGSLRVKYTLLPSLLASYVHIVCSEVLFSAIF